MQYPWKRFWCPHDGAYSLADSGYLYDPDSEYGKTVNPQLASLSEFEASPCIVLLGEPGIGKSTEFCSEVDRTAAIAAASGDACHSINLKEYQTDSLLVRDVFEHPVVAKWLSGSHVLHLFLDSLDEGRLEVRNIASILSGRLRRLEPYSDRLRIRIACRTAEWLPSLEDALTSLWSSEGAVRVLELMPLRKVDVGVAAEANQIDCDQFFEEVSRVTAQAFAANPISLSFLINIYRRSGTLPPTKYELYEAGCRCLCDEFSQSRRDAGHFGQLTGAERLAVASRVAAMMVFSGKTVIDTSVSSGIGDEAVTVSELAGGTEAHGEDQVNVNEEAVRDALSTTLFSGRGLQRLGFSHRTYAEFLAARYLTQRGLDQTQVVSLLFHPECDTRVVPQLAETAAWVAVKDDGVFERMMEGDPQTLLRSDVATAGAATKTRLVARLLKGYRSGDLDDSDWGLREHYYKLRHPSIADQLANTFRDKNELVVTRRFIADLAEECRVDELGDVLCEVALDGTDDTHIRAQAAHAIVRIGNDTSIERLKPLGLGVAGADPEDELRGSALSGL